MSQPEEQHQECTNRIIQLANAMKSEGIETSIISGALMTASGIYATYLAAGNNGTLTATGVKKATDVYRQTLEQFQNIKKNQIMKDRISG